MRKPTNTLTVLICTHNRADLLAKVIALAERRPPARMGWEVGILVMANACSDARPMRGWTTIAPAPMSGACCLLRLGRRSRCRENPTP
jgi:hypothetical protein